MPTHALPTSGFCLPALADLLGEFADAGYRTVRFGDADGSDGQLLLRHDVDMSLVDAVAVAEVEAALGVESTFFFMVRGDCYSLLDGAARDLLGRVTDAGRRIGLHLDVALYADDEIVDGAERELDILAWASGAEPEAISFHRPAAHLVGGDGVQLRLPHSYEPRFVRDIAYLSDSRGAFHHGVPTDSDAFAARSAIQLLLHPVWWASPGVPENAPTRLRGLVADQAASFSARLARNCRTYLEMTR